MKNRIKIAAIDIYVKAYNTIYCGFKQKNQKTQQNIDKSKYKCYINNTI